jgi:hypothetical protein
MSLALRGHEQSDARRSADGGKVVGADFGLSNNKY